MREGFLRMLEVTNNYLTGHPVEDKSVSVRLAVLVSLRSCEGAKHRCIITGGMAHNPGSVTVSLVTGTVLTKRNQKIQVWLLSCHLFTACVYFQKVAKFFQHLN